ncbi:MAG: hypothetical protein QM736_17440 [Vicinamibacterales bacterium]
MVAPASGRISSWIFESGKPGDLRADADADPLDRLDRHERLRETPIELAVPLHVAAETDGQTAHDHLEAATDRVARFLRGVDDLLHLRFDITADAVQL